MCEWIILIYIIYKCVYIHEYVVVLTYLKKKEHTPHHTHQTQIKTRRDAVSLGKNCVGVEMLPDDEEAEAENRGRVLLRFEDGGEVRANCVLAADGVHSGESVEWAVMGFCSGGMVVVQEGSIYVHTPPQLTGPLPTKKKCQPSPPAALRRGREAPGARAAHLPQRRPARFLPRRGPRPDAREDQPGP